jgi:TolB-like protein
LECDLQNEPTRSAELTTSPSEEEVHAAVERVTGSPDFSGSLRRTSLLRHLVSETLSGRHDRLKGTSIAIDVFGRDADFDPQTDAVVRSEARRLRQALASYYIGTGDADPIRIVLPKGSYIPRFECRGPEAARQNAPAAVAPVGNAPEAPIGPVHVTENLNLGRPARGSRALARAKILLAIPIALVGAGVLAMQWLERPARMADSGAFTPSVLVVPFKASGPGADEFALGTSAQLIADLMRFSSFRLYTLADSLSRDADSSGAGPNYDADYVVRGTVGSDGRSLSVAVRLVDTADGRVVWSDSYTEAIEPGPLVAMQAGIAGEIATAIGQPYGAMLNAAAERIDAASASGAGMASYACVLRAHTYRQSNSSDLYAPVRQCLEEAAIRDPDYAEAWAMLAYLRLDGGRFGYEADAASAYIAARASAARALSIDSRNVQATKALSLVEHYDGRFDESQRLARAALALNPNDPDTLAQLGWRLSVRGNFDEGIPYLRSAIERSAKPPAWYFQPIAVERLMAHDMVGMLEAAERASADGSSVSDAFLAIAYGKLGLRAMAREALDRIAKKWPLIDRDPAAALGIHRLREDQIAAIVAGLRAAGWQPPDESDIVASPSASTLD